MQCTSKSIRCMIAGKLYVAMSFTAHLVIVDASMRLRISEFPMQHSQRRNTVIESVCRVALPRHWDCCKDGRKQFCHLWAYQSKGYKSNLLKQFFMVRYLGFRDQPLLALPRKTDLHNEFADRLQRFMPSLNMSSSCLPIIDTDLCSRGFWRLETWKWIAGTFAWR